MPLLSRIGSAAALGLHLSGGGRKAVAIAISGSTNNYVLNTAKVTGYEAGNTDVTLTINGGVTVGSASTGSYAFDVDTSWNVGDTLKIITAGAAIKGLGGSSGGAGGPALRAQRAVSIDNTSGAISGGGGSGGTGGSATVHGAGLGGYPVQCNAASASGTGGSGGAGAGSQGAAAGGSAGSTGNVPSDCTSGGSATGGTGGTGGAFGATGATGGSGTTYGGAHWDGYGWVGGDTAPITNAGSAGAAGGAAVNGNSNITWIATGTRNGGIS